MQISIPIGQSMWELKNFCWNPTTSQLGINVTHYLLDNVTATEMVDVNEVAQDLSDQVKAAYVVLLSDTCFYLGCEVKMLQPTLSASFGSLDEALPGTGVAEPLPNQVTGLISWASVDPSRHGRGRIYVPFPTVADAEPEQIPTPAYVTGCQGLADAYLGITAFNATTPAPWTEPASLVIVDRGPPITYVPVGAAYARQRFGTQRRRGNYGAVNELPLWASLP